MRNLLIVMIYMIVGYLFYAWLSWDLFWFVPEPDNDFDDKRVCLAWFGRLSYLLIYVIPSIIYINKEKIRRILGL